MLGGLGLAVLLGVARGVPGHDLAVLVGLAFGVALAVTVAAWVALAVSRGASLQIQAVIVTLASVGATALGVLAAAEAMFVSTHDLTALFVVLTAAATVGVLGAVELGSRVGRASATLGALTRRIGDADGAAALASDDLDLDPTPIPSSSTAELDRLARELAEMGRRLEEARSRERALERARRELVAWVSHDLRTPLAGVRAMVEALEDGVVDDPETVEQYHRAVHAETARLSSLVDDLFELSRIEADALSLSLERASLGDVVSDAVAAAQVLAAAKGVRLEGRLHERLPLMSLATPEMGRVVRNLLDNAIRHTPTGGLVIIELGRDGDCACLTVSDECGGIPDEDLERVFDPAYRGDTARTPADRGGGLGLAIARGLTEAHAGQVAVGNGEAGCRFTVRLPLG
jgi:signal transduction histidine kinase